MGASPQSAAIRSIPWSVRSSTSWARINGHDAVVDLQNHHVVGYSDCHSWLSLDREVRQTRTSAIGTTAVRNWVREQGIDIKDRGRVPADIVAKYEAATGR